MYRPVPKDTPRGFSPDPRRLFSGVRFADLAFASLSLLCDRINDMFGNGIVGEADDGTSPFDLGDWAQ